MFWGLSSALDLYAEYLKGLKLPDEAAKLEEQPTELNILICGGADARHVIKTLAKRYTHALKPKLNIYLVEGCADIMARSMLLLGLALEPPDTFSLVCKTHLFMDLYGNSLLRPSSHHYMTAKARTLQRMICDEEQLQRLAPMLHVEALKYKERDGLEMAFSYWQPKEANYEIQRYWEHRVRALLGTRYDHREGAFDWDLSMTLKSREAQQICSQEYRYWRECGVAFVFPEYEHCKPNKTLAAGLMRNGRSYSHRGYVGDIQTGPFCGFGLRSSEERMHNSVHGDNDYRATDITERNLLELFHELHTQTAYEHDKSISRRYGSTKLLMTPLLSYNESDVTEAQQTYDQPWLEQPDVQVHFISPMEMYELQKGAPRWQNYFDIAFVAYNYFTFLSEEWFGAMREQSLFIQETKLLTVERDEPVQKFEKSVRDVLKQAGLKPCINYQAINTKNMFLKYKKTLGGEGDANEDSEENLEECEEEIPLEYHDMLQICDGQIIELKEDKLPAIEQSEPKREQQKLKLDNEQNKKSELQIEEVIISENPKQTDKEADQQLDKEDSFTEVTKLMNKMTIETQDKEDSFTELTKLMKERTTETKETE